MVGLKLSHKAPYKSYHIYVCYERERSRINRIERQDEMRVHEQDANWFKLLNLVKLFSSHSLFKNI
jgi:hypothetical protein